MIDIDTFQQILDDIAVEIPEDLYRGLNGGIMLLPQAKTHPEGGGLYIMGEYRHDRMMGRSIAIYYGSFAQVFGYLPPDGLRGEIKRVLIHEFTHHIEGLAGERGLEYKDAEKMAGYKKRPKI